MRIFKTTLAWLALACPLLAVPDEVYVAYTTGNDSTGAGTSGSPWKTIQKALDTVNHGGDGVRINVKAGETQVIATNALSTTTYLATNGAGSASEPLIIQGYTSSAGDGGIGTIEGTTNSLAIWTGTDTDQQDYVQLRDLSMTSGQGSGYAVVLDNYCSVDNCTIVSPFGGIDIDVGSVNNCTITWDSLYAVQGSASVGVYDCKIILADGAMRDCILAGNAVGNLLDLRTGTTDAARIAIQLSSSAITNVCSNNTIVAAITSGASGADGIYSDAPFSRIQNNYIHGFGATGSAAIELTAAASNSSVRGNACFSCTAGITNGAIGTIGQTSMSNIAGSGVTNAGTGDFTPTSYLIDAGYPTAVGGTSHYSTIGAITTAHTAGGLAVDPIITGN
jgi:hypothetical protein